MKLRFQSNSIRLRLKRGEVDRLIRTGCIEETVRFGDLPGQTLLYRLEASDLVKTAQAELKNGEVTVRVPTTVAAHWATTDEVGIEANQPLGSGDLLQVLVEKDFACLDNPEADNTDTFPHPMAGSKC